MTTTSLEKAGLCQGLPRQLVATGSLDPHGVSLLLPRGITSRRDEMPWAARAFCWAVVSDSDPI